MANNHGGDVEHGYAIIEAIAEAAHNSPFAITVKFQFRNLDTYVHSSYRSRIDFKYVRRVQEMHLS